MPVAVVFGFDFVIAYLIGSISFAVVVSRVMGLSDPRTYGSNNPGATNVLRSGNRKAAVLTLLGDALKGYVAVLIARAVMLQHLGQPGWDARLVAIAAIAVFLGHLYPLFFRFKGGKGVATAAGVLFAIHPLLGLGTLITWLVIAVCFRYSSMAALVAAVFAPLADWFMFGAGPVNVAVIAMSLLLIWRHRTNIVKLVRGQESRLGAKK